MVEQAVKVGSKKDLWEPPMGERAECWLKMFRKGGDVFSGSTIECSPKSHLAFRLFQLGI